MQISIGGQDVAPLEVAKGKNAIMLAKDFVAKHSLKKEQIMVLSQKIDDIRDSLLAQENAAATRNIGSLAAATRDIDDMLFAATQSTDNSHSHSQSTRPRSESFPSMDDLMNATEHSESQRVGQDLMDLLSLDTPVAADPVESQPFQFEHHNAEAYAASLNSVPVLQPKPPSGREQEHELQSIRNELSTFYQQQKGSSSHQSRAPAIDITIQNRQTSKIINKRKAKRSRTPRKSRTMDRDENNSKEMNSRKREKKKLFKSGTARKRRASEPPKHRKDGRRKDWWNKLHDDNARMSKKKEQKTQIASAKKRRKEIEKCTFKPRISAPARTLKRDGSKIWKRIVDPMGERKGSRLKQLRQRKRVKEKEKYKKECTFRPRVSRVSQVIMEEKTSNDIYLEKTDLFDRLHNSPKRKKSTHRKHCPCCSPEKPKARSAKRRSRGDSNAKPRYIALHELSKRKKTERFHPDEDITFKPRICDYKRGSQLSTHRKSVVNQFEHLHNAHTSSSTLHKKSSIATPKKMSARRASIPRLSESSRKILEQVEAKHGGRLYYRLCGERECELISVPFDRILNPSLFETMSDLDRLIVRSMEKYCARKSKIALRQKQFGQLYTKLLPKCKNKIPMGVDRKK